ncbi:hypothetical protein SDC9_182159 [bioreactor metagenome]|uniref:Uncharacterized protein n=1 Tax=bioreactor metagenome TaxID=1076179 RepID=A0A645H6Q2_9ZZZZ
MLVGEVLLNGFHDMFHLVFEGLGSIFDGGFFEQIVDELIKIAAFVFRFFLIFKLSFDNIAQVLDVFKGAQALGKLIIDLRQGEGLD